MANSRQFEWLNKQGVKSDSGFSLQCIGRFEWEYRENGKAHRLEGEATFAGGHGFAFAPGWCASLPPEEAERIEQNIQEAMSFMDLKAEFD